MAYNAEIADRVLKVLEGREGLTERKMFGGIAFLLNGNMCVGVWKRYLIVRLGKDKHEQAMAQPFAKEFDLTGRVMKGWAMIDRRGVETDDDLREWVRQAARFASSLPAK